MEQLGKYINEYTLIAGITGIIYGLFDDKIYLAGILLGFVAADFIVGILMAFCGKSRNTKNGGFSSTVCYNGLLKKSLIMLILLVAIGVDRVLGDSHILRDATLLFFIAEEGLSILENAAIAGLRLPQKLKSALEKLHDKEDGQ